MSEKAKMVVEIEGIKFEKYPKSNTVNIYVGGTNTNCFTDYSIGSDFEKFEKSCQEYLEYEKGGCY